MGAWGTGPFDNDDAADFAGDLSDLAGSDVAAAVLGDALLAVTAADGYIEGPEMSRAIAAAAVVAIFAKPSLQAPSPLEQSWLSSIGLDPSDSLKAEAARSLTRAFEAEGNEWHELWAEAGLLEEVRAKLSDHVAAVSGNAT